MTRTNRECITFFLIFGRTKKCKKCPVLEGLFSFLNPLRTSTDSRRVRLFFKKSATNFSYWGGVFSLANMLHTCSDSRSVRLFVRFFQKAQQMSLTGGFILIRKFVKMQKCPVRAGLFSFTNSPRAYSNANQGFFWGAF